MAWWESRIKPWKHRLGTRKMDLNKKAAVPVTPTMPKRQAPPATEWVHLKRRRRAPAPSPTCKSDGGAEGQIETSAKESPTRSSAATTVAAQRSIGS